ncbi:MAG: FecR family protein [Bacteroides sp.]|nr:FecR family protein [Bacteroides sp.]
MKNLDEVYIISKLIVRELTEGLEEEDKLILKKWKEESKLHSDLYIKILEGEKRKKRDQTLAMIDVQKALNKVNKKIKNNHNVVLIKKWSIGIAALITIFLSTTLYINFYSKNKLDNIRLSQVSTIKSGSVKATLKLNNGTVLQLDGESSDTLMKYKGIIINRAKGRLVYNKDLDKQFQAKEKKEIYNEVEVPMGGEYSLTLSDGTRVWMNSDSKIKYPVDFNSQNRRVWISGEVYFEVAHNKDKPFFVNVGDVSIKVLGTKFNVESYKNEDFIATTLVEGSVQLTKNNESVIIRPNERAITKINEKKFKIEKVRSRDYILWKDGIFYFDNKNLAEIMTKLERWYNVSVFFQNSQLKDLRFSVEVKRFKNIEEVLNLISETNHVNFKINNSTIIVSN